MTVCNSVNLVFKDPGALQIANQFCSCPHVHDILSTFEDKIFIDVRTGSYPQIRVLFTESTSEGIAKAEIQIPKRMIQLKDTLANFILEIFNVKNHNDIRTLRDRATQGTVDMEEYAKALEKIEFNSRENAIDLSLKCRFIKQSEMKDITRDLEILLWNKEFDCHTDKIRERWIESFQEAYCEKNPKKILAK